MEKVCGIHIFFIWGLLILAKFINSPTSRNKYSPIIYSFTVRQSILYILDLKFEFYENDELMMTKPSYSPKYICMGDTLTMESDQINNIAFHVRLMIDQVVLSTIPLDIDRRNTRDKHSHGLHASLPDILTKYIHPEISIFHKVVIAMQCCQEDGQYNIL